MDPMALPARLVEYLAFARDHAHLFDSSQGGMRILLDPQEILAVEAEVGARLQARGQDPAQAQIGIAYRDPWLLMFRDAVEFPDGARRTHARLMNVGNNGAAVLPVLEGRVVLMRTFRHGPRRWLWEIPRGAIEDGQGPEEAAHAEVREEIGGRIRELLPLGFVYGSTQLYLNGAHLFLGRLDGYGAPQLAEAISAIECFTVAEVERMLRDGEILDGISVAAFLHARLRGLV